MTLALITALCKVHDIFVKVKLEVTRISTILNVFDSSRSNDVTQSTFCPNFARWLLDAILSRKGIG